MAEQAKHTPGPWTESDGDINAMDRKIVIGQVETHDTGAVIAEANARLIAAAPDLLEEATYVANLIEGEPGHESCLVCGECEDRPDNWHQGWCPVPRCQTAIRKAKGED